MSDTAPTISIAIVTSSRSDYRYIYKLMKLCDADDHTDLKIIVMGMHLAPEYGNTYTEIIDDGFEITTKVNNLIVSDKRSDMSQSFARGVAMITDFISISKLDVMVVVGDRYEMLAASVSALMHNIPVAHIGGGEVTVGAVDDAIRNAITKMSHIHFPSHLEAKKNILQMGEKPSCVFCFGSPGVEDILSLTLLDRKDLDRKYQLDPAKGIMLITLHPETIGGSNSLTTLFNLFEAIQSYSGNVLFTASNADLDGQSINSAIDRFAQDRLNTYLVYNMGREDYISFLKHASVMVGNSSSGLCEAPVFKLPVVNIGNRQKGRLRGDNVIDVCDDAQGVSQGIAKALSRSFRSSINNMINPYGGENVSQQIFAAIKKLVGDSSILCKEFNRYECV